MIIVPTKSHTRRDIALYIDRKMEIDNSTFKILLPELFWRKEGVKEKHYWDLICQELQIPNDTIEISPSINEEEKDNILRGGAAKGLNLDNFVYVLPESTAVKPIPIDFWRKLILELNNAKCDVYLNVIVESNHIDGTKNFHTNIKEAWTLAQKAKFIVGMRSGLLELLTSSGNTPTIAIYNGDNRIARNSIKVMNGINHENLHEYDFTDTSFDEDSIIRQIINWIRQR